MEVQSLLPLTLPLTHETRGTSAAYQVILPRFSAPVPEQQEKSVLDARVQGDERRAEQTELRSSHQIQRLSVSALGL